jgi:hypothetical protein
MVRKGGLEPPRDCSRQPLKLERRQAREEKDQLVLLEQERQQALAELKEAQERQVADHTARNDQELERHVQEREDAKRLVAEVEAREEALRRDEELKRDGPDWPPPRAR